MLQPLVRRTWAPRGQTPVHYSWDRHDRLSVIAGLTLAPERRRVGQYFDVYSRNLCADDVVAFIRQVHRHARRPIIAVCDRWSAHRSAVKRLQDSNAGWFDVEWLPAYAPDLNPVEAIWSHTKYADLANFLADDVNHLEDAVVESLCEQYDNQPLKRSFFRAAELQL
jgi:transposase